MMALVALLDPRPATRPTSPTWIYAAAGGATAATIVAARARVLPRRLDLEDGVPRRGGRHELRPDRDHDQGDDRAGRPARRSSASLTTWQTYTAVAFGIGGLVLVQWALHTGPLLAAQPGFTLMDPLVSILWGMLVFGETTRTGWWLVPATAGAVAVGVGVVVLAHSPLLAQVNEQSEPATCSANRRPA